MLRLGRCEFLPASVWKTSRQRYIGVAIDVAGAGIRFGAGGWATVASGVAI